MTIIKEIETILVYENKQIQTGIQEIENWVTSDGRKFKAEEAAEAHEFNWRVSDQHKNPNLHNDPEIFEFKSLEDALRMDTYRWSNGYNYVSKNYVLEKLLYPNKFVRYEEFIGCNCNQADYEYGYCDCSNAAQSKVHIVTLDEYKKMMLEHIESL